LPSVNALYREFKDQGFEVLLIDFRESPDHVRKVAKERGYVAPVLLDESGDVTGRVYGVWGPPTIYVVDRGGRLIGRAVGPRDWTTPTAKTFIRELLGFWSSVVEGAPVRNTVEDAERDLELAARLAEYALRE